MEKREHSCTVSRNINWLQPLWRTEWRYLKKKKIELPYDLAIPLLGVYLEKTIIQTHACTPVFVAALFTIARRSLVGCSPWGR